jgi:hypothetical protein
VRYFLLLIVLALSVLPVHAGLIWDFGHYQRPVEIVLRPRAGGEAVRLATKEDPRRCMTGRTTAVRISAPLPKRLKPGEYEVFLSLPDLAESRRARPEYAVCFANPGIRDAAGGMNRLAHVVRIGR